MHISFNICQDIWIPFNIIPIICFILTSTCLCVFLCCILVRVWLVCVLIRLSLLWFILIGLLWWFVLVLFCWLVLVGLLGRFVFVCFVCSIWVGLGLILVWRKVLCFLLWLTVVVVLFCLICFWLVVGLLLYHRGCGVLICVVCPIVAILVGRWGC